MFQQWAAGDPSESTQILTGRGIWVRQLFWVLRRPQRVRRALLSVAWMSKRELGKRNVPGRHSLHPRAGPALKTSPAGLLGLTFKAPSQHPLFLASLWLPAGRDLLSACTRWVGGRVGMGLWGRGGRQPASKQMYSKPRSLFFLNTFSPPSPLPSCSFFSEMVPEEGEMRRSPGAS